MCSDAVNCCDVCRKHLRSSEYPDGGNSVETVAVHQVWDVVLDLHLLTREAGPLKQLSSGGAVFLATGDAQRGTLLLLGIVVHAFRP